MAVVLALDVPQHRSRNHTVILGWPWPLRGCLYATMIVLIFVSRSQIAVPFIYFQF